MYKIYKLNVAGYEYINVNTKTGEITGKTYNARKWIKSNFDATWDKENKCWKADPEVIAKEFENTNYYAKYINDIKIVEEEEDKAEKVEKTKETKKTKKTKKTKETNEIIEKELVNRNDGFYCKETHRSGKITYSFVG